MKVKFLTGFTLIELIVVMVIIAILASLAVPTYTKTAEKTKNKEARTMIQLIYQAERMHRLESGSSGGYVSCGSTDNCNNKLDLSINSQDWDFTAAANPGSPPTVTITATRQGSDGRTISLSSNNPDNYTCSSTEPDKHYCD